MAIAGVAIAVLLQAVVAPALPGGARRNVRHVTDAQRASTVAPPIGHEAVM